MRNEIGKPRPSVTRSVDIDQFLAGNRSLSLRRRPLVEFTLDTVERNETGMKRFVRAIASDGTTVTTNEASIHLPARG